MSTAHTHALIGFWIRIHILVESFFTKYITEFAGYRELENTAGSVDTCHSKDVEYSLCVCARVRACVRLLPSLGVGFEKWTRNLFKIFISSLS